MELFRQAVTIMVVGMGLVFAFLAIVIGAVEATARIIWRLEGVPREESAGEPGTMISKQRRAAAIAAALARFRQE